MTRSGCELQVTVCWSAGWTIYLSGELDGAGAAQLARVGAALADARIAAADFDLSGVTFVDTAGWAVLCEAMALVEESGAVVRARNPSPSVRRLVDIVRCLRSVDGPGAGHPGPGHQVLGPTAGMVSE
jgi:anti-anti-sigma factor